MTNKEKALALINTFATGDTEKAKELLENTTMKNYEIAEKVGFSDESYFSKVFKKMTGMTPMNYMKSR